MLTHFLRLLGRAAENFPKLLGGNWVSLLLPTIIFVLIEGNELRNGGLAAVRAKLGKNVAYLGCAYVVLFSWSVILTTYRDHTDLVESAQRTHSQLQTKSNEFASCTSDLKNANGVILDKQSLVDTLQKTMIASQAPQQQQAANIASCIDSLAKMNPIIREHTFVISIPVGNIDFGGKYVSSNQLIAHYLWEVFIFTNEPQEHFHGDLRCGSPFSFVDPPTIIPEASFIMTSSPIPQPISDREFEIRIDQTGTIWNQTHPAYMRLSTTERSIGSCSFSKVE